MNDFKVGDKVIIKSWEQMCKEFKYGSDIYCNGIFVKDMKYLCGRELIIEQISTSGNSYMIQNIDGWTISFDMITYPDGYVAPNPLEIYTTEELQAEIDRRNSL